MDAVSEAKAREIAAGLHALAAEERAEILFAVESGSRAWGFPSPDSDYDVRFVYRRPLEWYLALDPGRDVIERPISDVLDLAGWDVGKALRLILKSNAALLEWLQSPIVYIERPGARAELLAFCAKALERRALLWHYLRLSERQIDAGAARGEPVKLKRFFYALRPAMALRWLRLRRGADGLLCPMAIGPLMDESDAPAPARNFVEAMIETKTRTRETGVAPIEPDLWRLIEAECAAARAELNEQGGPERPSAREAVRAEADAFFRRIVTAPMAAEAA